MGDTCQRYYKRKLSGLWQFGLRSYVPEALILPNTRGAKVVFLAAHDSSMGSCTFASWTILVWEAIFNIDQSYVRGHVQGWR